MFFLFLSPKVYETLKIKQIENNCHLNIKKVESGITPIPLLLFIISAYIIPNP